MSGGIAYVLDEAGDFAGRCNIELVGLGRVEDEAEAAELKELVRLHAAATKSARAARVLQEWDNWLPLFVRVLPNDYRRVLEAQARMRDKGLSEDEAVMAAFTENARAVTRASGS
jgi:glutamate synthase (ferredoxin)